MRTPALALLGALAFSAAGAAAGCAPGSVPSATTTTAVLSPDSLMRHAYVLAADSMRGRLVGTPENAKARAYVVREFRAAGLQPVQASFEVPVQVRSPRDSTMRTAVNVVGVVRGRLEPDRFIVVTAHYDHLGVRQGQIYNGADDNASGTAALIEIARWFARHPPANSILFVALDAEEGGLLGARGFVASPPVPLASLVVNVNMDMVGRNDRNELFAAGTSHYRFLRPYLDSVAARAPLTLRFGHDDPAGPRSDDWTTQSDHAAFHAAGIPFVYFGEEDHPDYHKPTDDPERLMPPFLGAAASTVLDAVRTFDRNLTAIATRPR